MQRISLRILSVLVFMMLFSCYSIYNLASAGIHENNAASEEKHQALQPVQSLKLIYSLFESEEEMPSFDVFMKAMKGYHQLKSNGQLLKEHILTIVDFRLSSNTKRLWIIDLKEKKVLHHTLVAHGRNTGDEFAEKFSNTPESHQSSLGFYVTGETYIGKHGTSLYLDGMEKNINDNARERYIVMHGADYVSESFIKQNGRLGRSFGCPSIPREVEADIISLIADKSCLFIYYPESNYEKQSAFINAALPDFENLIVWNH